VSVTVTDETLVPRLQIELEMGTGDSGIIEGLLAEVAALIRYKHDHKRMSAELGVETQAKLNTIGGKRPSDA
jgi:hypothetical protein